MKINKTVAWALMTTFLSASSFTALSQACTPKGANGTATKDGRVPRFDKRQSYIEGPRNQIYLSIPKQGYEFVHTPLHIQDPSGHYFDVGSDRSMNEKGSRKGAPLQRASPPTLSSITRTPAGRARCAFSF